MSDAEKKPKTPQPGKGECTVTYDDGQEVRLHEGERNMTLLDISLKNGIAHYHVCGRVARCSTCQVVVLEHPENLTPPTPMEERYATKRNLPENVRLACQAQVTGSVTVRRVVQDDDDVKAVRREDLNIRGNEQQMAVLFSDIREFTPFSARHMPYDVMHILNRYYTSMGEAIIRNNGYIHQYYGDGMMALFGFYARDPRQICLDAVKAGLGMIERLDAFNEYLERNFGERFSIGVGINFGDVLAGKIGHPKHVQLNVVGDAINRAARVESVTKETESPVVISDPVYWNIGASAIRVRPFRMALRGLGEKQRLYQVLGLAGDA